MAWTTGLAGQMRYRGWAALVPSSALVFIAPVDEYARLAKVGDALQKELHRRLEYDDELGMTSWQKQVAVDRMLRSGSPPDSFWECQVVGVDSDRRFASVYVQRALREPTLRWRAGPDFPWQRVDGAVSYLFELRGLPAGCRSIELELRDYGDERMWHGNVAVPVPQVRTLDELVEVVDSPECRELFDSIYFCIESAEPVLVRGYCPYEDENVEGLTLALRIDVYYRDEHVATGYEYWGKGARRPSALLCFGSPPPPVAVVWEKPHGWLKEEAPLWRARVSGCPELAAASAEIDENGVVTRKARAWGGEIWIEPEVEPDGPTGE
jgi:hypothetical protein